MNIKLQNSNEQPLRIESQAAPSTELNFKPKAKFIWVAQRKKNQTFLTVGISNKYKTVHMTNEIHRIEFELKFQILFSTFKFLFIFKFSKTT